MMTIFVGKKGQYYIFIALVLISFAFVAIRPEPITATKVDVFGELIENFERESTFVVNNALYEDGNVTERFDDFSSNYALYARTRSPNFRMLTLIQDEDRITITNSLGLAVNVSYGSSNVLLLDSQSVHTPKTTVTILSDDISYLYRFGESSYSVKALFRQKTDTGRRIQVMI